MKRTLRCMRYVGMLLVLTAMTGCGSPTNQDMDAWGADPAGGTRLEKTLTDDGEKTEVRAYALTTLVKSMKMAALKDALKKMPTAQQDKVVTAAAPALKALLTGSMEQQAAVKDALFLIAESKNSPAVKAALKGALLGWYETDFPKRASMGRYDWSLVMDLYGPEAAPVMLKAFFKSLLIVKHPPYLKKLVDAIVKLGNPELTAKAQKLLSQRIDKEFAPDQDGNEGGVSEETVKLTYDLKGPDIYRVLNKYMVMGDKIDANARLAMVESLSKDEKPNIDCRDNCLNLLKDSHEFREVRLVALSILKKIADERQLPAILKLADAERYIFLGGVMETMINRGGPKWIDKFFAAVPSIPDLGPADYNDMGDMFQRTPNKKGLEDYLISVATSSRYKPWQRGVALNALKKIGGKATVKGLQNMTKDGTMPPGSDATLGAMAEKAIAASGKRNEK